MFGEVLKRMMDKKGVRVKELSYLANITEGYISDLKKDRTSPRKDKLELIIKSLNTTHEEEKELREAWERDVSPESFVKKFDDLLEENKYLKSIVENKEENLALIDQLKLQKKVFEKVEKEKNDYKLYKDIFYLLPEKEREYILDIILKTLKLQALENGNYMQVKKELAYLEKAIKNGIDYED